MGISVAFVFLSAMLFGLATPLSKILLDGLTPFQLAGLLYVGAAIGLLPKVISEKGFSKVLRMGRNNINRLVGAILLGGVAGPVALLFGLKIAEASSVSMWLNLELVFTALLGHLLFQDYLGKLGWFGASGAVSAVVFTYIFFSPTNSLLLMGVLPIPAILFGVLYLIYSQYMSRRSGGNVNHDAHFIGAVFGFVYLPELFRPSTPVSFHHHSYNTHLFYFYFSNFDVSFYI